VTDDEDHAVAGADPFGSRHDVCCRLAPRDVIRSPQHGITII